MTTPASLSAPELQTRLERGDNLQLVDVREAQELELAALGQKVIHLPLSRSQDWAGQIESQIDRDRPVVVLCHAGMRSWSFGCWLMDTHGFADVWNLEGGIDAWSREVDPTVPRY